MVTPICEKCRRRNVISFHVEPKEAWRTVVLNRWRAICPLCFDAEAERVGVRYRLVGAGMNVVERQAGTRQAIRKEAAVVLSVAFDGQGRQSSATLSVVGRGVL
jgi:hypothetical protein